MPTARRKTKPDEKADEALRTEQRVKDTILQLTRYRGWSQVELATRAGFGRANLNGKLTASTKITIDELATLAWTLGVPTEILLREPKDALLWVLSNETMVPAKPVVPLRSASRRSHAGGANFPCSPTTTPMRGFLLPAS